MTANGKTGAPDFLTDDELAAEIPETAWSTVSTEEVDEQKFTFDEIGDQFVGKYEGSRTMDTDNGKLVQFRFSRGEHHYFINGSWSLMQGMANAARGRVCRITWVSVRDTGKESPLRIFKVDVANPGIKGPTYPA